MNAVSELTLTALDAGGTEPLTRYADGLREACAASPPPFGKAWYGDKYRHVACDPSWLAGSLISNASKEGDGARILWDLAAETADPQIAEQVRQHAIDEARHARLYIAMLDLAFPGAVDDGLRPRLMGLSPGYTTHDRPPAQPPKPEDRLFDELIQINIGEIRTRIHQLLLRPVIMAHCAADGQHKLSRILDSLLADETRHVTYTAQLIEQALARDSSGFFRATMRERLAEFNEITLHEVGGLTFDGA